MSYSNFKFVQINMKHLLYVRQRISTELADVREDCIFHGQQLQTIFLKRALKFEILSTTLYKCAVLFQSRNYKE